MLAFILHSDWSLLVIHVCTFWRELFVLHQALENLPDSCCHPFCSHILDIFLDSSKYIFTKVSLLYMSILTILLV